MPEMNGPKIDWDKVDERVAALQSILKDKEYGLPSWYFSIKDVYIDIGNELGLLPALIKQGETS